MFYPYGLFVARTDFVARTNHDFAPDFLTQSKWPDVQAMAGVYTEATDRVAFSGWDWTSGGQDERYGHHAMYVRTDDAPIFRPTAVTSTIVDMLFSLGTLSCARTTKTGQAAILTCSPSLKSRPRGRRPARKPSRSRGEGPCRPSGTRLTGGYRIGFVGSGDSHWMRGTMTLRKPRAGIVEPSDATLLVTVLWDSFCVPRRRWMNPNREADR